MKVVIFLLVAVIAGFIIFSMYASSNPTKSVGSGLTDTQSQSSIPEHSCEVGTPVSGRVFVGTKEAPMMRGPGKNTGRVVNESATEVSRRTVYVEVSSDNDLESICDAPNWLMVKIVGADGRPVNWETGWIEKKSLIPVRTLTDDQKKGLYWNVNTDPDVSTHDKAWVKRGAIKALADKNCVRIVKGFRDPKRRDYYLVSCMGQPGTAGYDIYFRKEDVDANKPFSPPEAFNEELSRQMCEMAIRERVAHPSTLDIQRFTGYEDRVTPIKNRVILQAFSAKNGFGLKLTYSARCIIEPDGKFDITISEHR